MTYRMTWLSHAAEEGLEGLFNVVYRSLLNDNLGCIG